MCEQLGTEPDPSKAPPTLDVFPEEVQQAFIVFNHLPDRWDGMSGSYLGKDWSSIGFFLDLFDIEEKKIVVYFITQIENKQVKNLSEKAEKKRKAEERKAKSGGQKFTHNVQG